MPKTSEIFGKKEKREKKALEVVSLANQIDIDRAPYLQNQVRWYELYRGIINERTLMGEKSSWANYHVPITAWNIYQSHASLMRVYELSDPLVFLNPKNEIARRHKQQSERYFNSLFRDEDQLNGMQILDELILQLEIHGNVTGFLGWNVFRDYSEELFRISIEKVPSKENLARAILDLSFRKDIYKNVKIEKAKKIEERNIFWEVTFIENFDGTEIRGEGAIEVFGDDFGWDIILKRDKFREHPVVYIPPIEASFKSHDYAWKGIDRCKIIGRRIKLSLDEIQNGFLSDKYDLLTKKDLENIEKLKSGHNVSSIGKDVEMKREITQGQTRTLSGADVGEFDALEVFILDDPEDKGYPKQWIYTILNNPTIMLRARQLQSVFRLRNGRRPVFDTPYIPDKDAPGGIGIPDVLEGPQLETNEIHSIGVDWGRITNSPTIIADHGAGIPPGVRLIQPGGVTVVDDISRITWPQWPNMSQSWAANQEAALLGYVERLGIPDIGFGRIPAGRSQAFRTTGTTQLLLSQMDSRLEVTLRRVNRGLSRMASILWDIEKSERRIPLTYLIPDEDGNEVFSELPKDAMSSPYSFEFAPTSIVANKDFVLQREMAKHQFISNQLHIQAGIATAQNIYESARKVLRAFDEDDYHLLLTKPKDASNVPVLTGNQVLQEIQIGHFPKISPLADLEEHMRTISDFVNSDDFNNWPADMKIRVIEYIGLVQRVAVEKQQQFALSEAASRLQLPSMAGEGMGPGAPAQSVGVPVGPPDVASIPREFVSG